MRGAESDGAATCRADASFLDTSLDGQLLDLAAGVGALLLSLLQVGNHGPLYDAAAQGARDGRSAPARNSS